MLHIWDRENNLHVAYLDREIITIKGPVIELKKCKQCKIQIKIISVGTKWYGKNDI